MGRQLLNPRWGHPPFLELCFAAKDAPAESYAAKLIRFGIHISIVVPGPFTSGTNHFQDPGAPADLDQATAYDAANAQLRASHHDRPATLIPPGIEDLLSPNDAA